jgi:uncharacterized membrane protein
MVDRKVRCLIVNWPVSVGLGVGLGVAASKEMDLYNSLMDQIAQETSEIQKKIRLVNDLAGFNSSIALVGPALSAFKSSLQIIEGVWTDIGTNLAFVANNYGVDQLSSLPWVVEALKIGDATKKWQSIGEMAQQFTQNSLVSYDFNTQWGKKIPA